jgi:hypothetical protein
MTPLLELLRECSAADREFLAQHAGTSVNYLYSLAGGHRRSPRADLAFRIEDASVALGKRVVTAREIATQSLLKAFSDC